MIYNYITKLKNIYRKNILITKLQCLAVTTRALCNTKYECMKITKSYPL